MPYMPRFHQPPTELLGRAADVTASAPGRVNLIGEHTDYNDGFVLPTVIPQRTHVALAKRSDRLVRARSASADGPEEYELGREQRCGRWIDYLQGVTGTLAREGHAIGGVDVVISSEVPVGSGLSSSAALEVAMLRALRSAFDLDLDDLTLAKLAQRGENELVGAPVGILDPLACSLGSPGIALFVDTRTLTIEQVPLPSSLELVVIDSGVTHDHVLGGYRQRRAECEDAARRLDVPALRDVLPGEPQIRVLPAPLDRRVRHVVTENARVLRTVDALRSGDLGALGELFAASHASMRDDYEVSVPEVDRIVARAATHDGVVAARLTGGGFGGSVVVLAHAGRAGEVAASLATIPGARALVPAG